MLEGHEFLPVTGGSRGSAPHSTRRSLAASRQSKRGGFPEAKRAASRELAAQMGGARLTPHKQG